MSLSATPNASPNATPTKRTRVTLESKLHEMRLQLDNKRLKVSSLEADIVKLNRKLQNAKNGHGIWRQWLAAQPNNAEAVGMVNWYSNACTDISRHIDALSQQLDESRFEEEMLYGLVTEVSPRKAPRVPLSHAPSEVMLPTKDTLCDTASDSSLTPLPSDYSLSSPSSPSSNSYNPTNSSHSSDSYDPSHASDSGHSEASKDSKGSDDLNNDKANRNKDTKDTEDAEDTEDDPNGTEDINSAEDANSAEDTNGTDDISGAEDGNGTEDPKQTIDKVNGNEDPKDIIATNYAEGVNNIGGPEDTNGTNDTVGVNDIEDANGNEKLIRTDGPLTLSHNDPASRAAIQASLKGEGILEGLSPAAHSALLKSLEIRNARNALSIDYTDKIFSRRRSLLSLRMDYLRAKVLIHQSKDDFLPEEFAEMEQELRAIDAELKEEDAESKGRETERKKAAADRSTM